MCVCVFEEAPDLPEFGVISRVPDTHIFKLEAKCAPLKPILGVSEWTSCWFIPPPPTPYQCRAKSPQDCLFDVVLQGRGLRLPLGEEGGGSRRW